MDRIPLYLVALIVAIATTPLDIFDLHQRNIGIGKAEPWRRKTSGMTAQLRSVFASVVQFLWPHRQRIAAVALLLAFMFLAPSHAGAVAVIGIVTQQQVNEAADEAKGVLASAMRAAESQNRVLSPSERASIDAAIAKARTLKEQLDGVRSDASMLAQIERLTGGMTPGSSHRGGASLGAQFVNSETFRWLRQTKDSRAGVWTSPASELADFSMHATTISEASGSGGQLVVTDYQPGILPTPTRPLTVADLIAPGATDSNTVGYMRETTYTNAAAAVAEGATKPESTLVFDAVTDPVRKIAHWVPVTEEMLEDVPAMKGYLDTRLRLGVDLAEDDELINGSVVAPHIIGFLARTGLAAAQPRGADTNADCIAKQIAAIFTATLMQPTGIVMNPINWLTIQLLKTSTGEYVSGKTPFDAPQTATLWGLPVALSPVIVANTALVGAFRTASQLFRKGGMRVEASNSHSDFFVKNLVAVRAERREALCVYRPAAFGTCTGLN